MKVVELYSGIGGMHFALKGSALAGMEPEVIFAADLNPVCNEIYRHNFPKTNLQCRNMNSLTAEEMNSMKPDMILMSPPCQPFTRLGKRRDVQDHRNNSFLHFIKIIPELTTVNYIVLENVKGFEVSETRKTLVETLQKCQYKYEEYLLSPSQFGICNSRLRYYLLAKKSTTVPQNPNTIEELPPHAETFIHKEVFPQHLSSVLEYDPKSEEWEENLIPVERMKKYFSVSDIVAFDDRRSCCFTKGYTRLFEGSGSLICGIPSNELVYYVQKIRACDDNDARERLIEFLKLRHFTPREIARCMHFPEHFSFPEFITKRQQYKVLCNSVNVYVVSFLISYLINDFCN